MNKLTKEQIEEIKELRKNGMRIIDISRKLKINPNLVSYHCLSDEKKKKRLNKQRETFMSKPPEERKKIYKKRYPYIKNYLNKRYKEDEGFRERIRQYQNKKSKSKEVKNDS